MALHCLTAQLRFVGSGTGPQTLMPHGAASCGHDAHAHTPGQTTAVGDCLACCLN